MHWEGNCWRHMHCLLPELRFTMYCQSWKHWRRNKTMRSCHLYFIIFVEINSSFDELFILKMIFIKTSCIENLTVLVQCTCSRLSSLFTFFTFSLFLASFLHKNITDEFKIPLKSRAWLSTIQQIQLHSATKVSGHLWKFNFHKNASY